MDKHKARMEAKKLRRERLYNMQKQDPVYVPANLSTHHVDYGMSWEDHLAAKKEREQK